MGQEFISDLCKYYWQPLLLIIILNSPQQANIIKLHFSKTDVNCLTANCQLFFKNTQSVSRLSKNHCASHFSLSTCLKQEYTSVEMSIDYEEWDGGHPVFFMLKKSKSLYLLSLPICEGIQVLPTTVASQEELFFSLDSMCDLQSQHVCSITL